MTKHFRQITNIVLVTRVISSQNTFGAQIKSFRVLVIPTALEAPWRSPSTGFSWSPAYRLPILSSFPLALSFKSTSKHGRIWSGTFPTGFKTNASSWRKRMPSCCLSFMEYWMYCTCRIDPWFPLLSMKRSAKSVARPVSATWVPPNASRTGRWEVSGRFPSHIPLRARFWDVDLICCVIHERMMHIFFITQWRNRRGRCRKDYLMEALSSGWATLTNASPSSSLL